MISRAIEKFAEKLVNRNLPRDYRQIHAMNWTKSRSFTLRCRDRPWVSKQTLPRKRLSSMSRTKGLGFWDACFEDIGKQLKVKERRSSSSAYCVPPLLQPLHHCCLNYSYWWLVIHYCYHSVVWTKLLCVILHCFQLISELSSEMLWWCLGRTALNCIECFIAWV